MGTQRKLRKSMEITKEKTEKLPPIVVIPDATYLDDKGCVIPTDVIVVKDPKMFAKMQEVLKAWGKEPLGIPGTRDEVEG